MGKIESLQKHILDDITQLTEAYVEELARYADYLVEKNKNMKNNGSKIKTLLGTMKSDLDGLEFQRKIRAEWD